MSGEITVRPAQDTIEFVLSAERPITNETVRMTVGISAKVGDADEETIRRQIHDALGTLVNVRWNLSNIRRQADGLRDEIISVTAVTRVPEKENRDLANRARALCRRGFTVNTPTVTYNFPIDEVEKNRSELRVQLLSAAVSEMQKINAALSGLKAPGGYRLGEFRTTEADEDMAQRFSNKLSASSYNGPGGDGEALAHTGKLVMFAHVTLRRDH